MALTPLYARAPKGERARGSVPRNRGKHMTLIASLSLEGMGAALIPRSGRPTPQPIALYVEQVMAPSSMPGRSCSWTTSRHTKAYGSERPSRRKAVNFFSRPRYSPDLSPLEEAFSKLKTALRRAGARTREVLEEAIGQALLTITALSGAGVVSALWISSSWTRKEELLWLKLLARRCSGSLWTWDFISL
jgi:hypothetical protein